MSDHRELIRRLYDTWNRDDFEGWLELFHPDVEWHMSGVFPDLDAVYRGRDGIAAFWVRVHEPWEEFRIGVEELGESGDRFWTATRFRAKGVDSGVDVDMRIGSAARVRDGLLAEVFTRRTPEEARDALG